MYTVWHVDKYKITFKLIIDHWPRARWLRNTELEEQIVNEAYVRFEVFGVMKIQVEVFWVVTPRRWRQQGPSKCWYPTIILYCVTTHKTST
jgi:hypothetical protein